MTGRAPDVTLGRMLRRTRTRLALTAGLGAVAVLPLLPAAGTASATYDPCDGIFLNRIYHDPANMLRDLIYCLQLGWPPYDAPMGTATWIDQHSA